MPILLHMLAKAIERDPTGIALIDGDREISRQEVLVYGAAFARVLREAGAEPGTHVGVMLPNGAAWAGAEFGCLLTGSVLVAINPMVPPKELKQLRETGRFDIIVTGGELKRLAATLEGCKTIDAAEVRPDSNDKDRAKELLGAAMERAKPEAPCTIIYTSGTTGASKAVVLSQENLGSNVASAQNVLHPNKEDRMLVVLPLFHSFGLLIYHMIFACGGTAVLMSRFSPNSVLDAIKNLRITYVIMVPPMYGLIGKALLKAKERAPDFIELSVSGGSALPPHIYALWNKVADHPLLQGYGQTEAAPLISVNLPEDNRYPTVGPPVKDVEVRIAGDDGEEMPQGEVGEVWVRGPNVMLGYYKDEEATKKTITEEGWLKTGDLGLLDENGWLSITGREKELIIVSGENVYPQEVENVISGVEGVADCAVLAGEDELRGEFVRACVVAQTKEENGEKKPVVPEDKLREKIKEACRENLATQKQPRRIEFFDELPRNALGKVLKRELDEMEGRSPKSGGGYSGAGNSRPGGGSIVRPDSGGTGKESGSGTETYRESGGSD